MTTDSSQYLSALHNQIDALFSVEGVRMLCFDLGVDFENLAGDTKSALVRELILQVARRNRLPDLLALLTQERPQAHWPNVPADFALPESLATADAVSPDNPVKSITVGNITGATGVAIGSNASATVTTERSSE